MDKFFRSSCCMFTKALDEAELKCLSHSSFESMKPAAVPVPLMDFSGLWDKTSLV